MRQTITMLNETATVTYEACILNMYVQHTHTHTAWRLIVRNLTILKSKRDFLCHVKINAMIHIGDIY